MADPPSSPPPTSTYNRAGAVLAQVRKMGNDLKKVINQRYSHVEIDIDGIFKMILLLAKKKVRLTFPPPSSLRSTFRTKPVRQAR